MSSVRHSNLFGSLLITFLLFVPLAQADVSLQLGAWSYHLMTGDDYDYTSSHDLVGIEYKKVMATTFRNSYGRRTYSLSGEVFSFKQGDWVGSVHVGIMRGYRKCYGDDGSNTNVCPLIVPRLSYAKYKVQPTILLMGEAVAGSIRIEF